MTDGDFQCRVCELVKMIPCGSVATYGQLAYLAGHPERPRMVGRILRDVPPEWKLPCHRVVNAAGRCAPGWTEQADLLKRENIVFRSNGNVDLDRCLWDCFGSGTGAAPFPAGLFPE